MEDELLLCCGDTGHSLVRVSEYEESKLVSFFRKASSRDVPTAVQLENGRVILSQYSVKELPLCEVIIGGAPGKARPLSDREVP